MKSPARISRLVSVFIMTSLFTACDSHDPTFSILADRNLFFQNGNVLAAKVDILWVTDNSGSMETSQRNVANNFQSFINTFQTKGYDFRIAVTTTDAYLALFNNNPNLSRFKGASDATRLLTNTTPDLNARFLENIMVGTTGNGDERAFQSFKAALTNPLNAGFPRRDAFFAVIIVSDEDDFSHDGTDFRGGQYSYPGIHTIQSYVDFLDSLTSSVAGVDRYNVSAVAIWDEACKTQLNNEFTGRKIGYRYGFLVEATTDEPAKQKASLCGNFGTQLELLSQTIAELTSQFYLDRVPDQNTIVVTVNDVIVPKDAVNGWTYNAANNSIVFHGTAIPASGSTILIDFDPLTIE